MEPLLPEQRLQLAVMVLSRPLAELRELLSTYSLRALNDGEVDGLDEVERQEAQADGRLPWTWEHARKLLVVDGQPEPDVEVTWEPFAVRANGTLPRFFEQSTTPPDVLWLLRAVRQRARTYERVARALIEADDVGLRDGGPRARQHPNALAQALGLHRSTVERVCAAGVMQVEDRVLRFEAFFSSAEAAPD